MSGLLRRAGWAMMTAAVLLPRPVQAAVARVDAGGSRFSPAQIQVDVNDSVIWEVFGAEAHTVTAADGSFDSATRGYMTDGDQFRWRFESPGTFAYYCRVHQTRGMKGQVIVVDPSASTTPSTRVALATTSTTATTAPPTTTASTAPATTTTRPLATSSSTSPAVATSTTAPAGTPVAPRAPVDVDPAPPVVGTTGSDADLPGAQAAARQPVATGEDSMAVLAVGAGLLLAVFGGVIGVRARRRSPRGPRT